MSFFAFIGDSDQPMYVNLGIRNTRTQVDTPAFKPRIEPMLLSWHLQCSAPNVLPAEFGVVALQSGAQSSGEVPSQVMMAIQEGDVHFEREQVNFALWALLDVAPGSSPCAIYVLVLKAAAVGASSGYLCGIF